MPYVLRCRVEDCKHHSRTGNHCTLDYITIDNDIMTSAGFLPVCEDYDEREDEECETSG